MTALGIPSQAPLALIIGLRKELAGYRHLCRRGCRVRQLVDEAKPRDNTVRRQQRAGSCDGREGTHSASPGVSHYMPKNLASRVRGHDFYCLGVSVPVTKAGGRWVAAEATCAAPLTSTTDHMLKHDLCPRYVNIRELKTLCPVGGLSPCRLSS